MVGNNASAMTAKPTETKGRTSRPLSAVAGLRGVRERLSSIPLLLGASLFAILGLAVTTGLQEINRFTEQAVTVAAAEGALAANRTIDALHLRLKKASAGSGEDWVLPDDVARMVLRIDPQRGTIMRESDLMQAGAIDALAVELTQAALITGQPQISDPFPLGSGLAVLAVSGSAPGLRSGPVEAIGILTEIGGLQASLLAIGRETGTNIALFRRDGRPWLGLPSAGSSSSVFSDGVPWATSQAMSASGTALAPLAMSDGGSGKMAWRTLGFFGLVSVAAIPSDPLSSPWMLHFFAPVVIAGIGICVAIAFVIRRTATAVRESRRHEATLTALERSEQRLKDLVESSSDWLWELDGQKRFAFVTGSIEQTAGLAPDYFYGKTIEEIADREYAPDDLSQALATLDAGWALREVVIRILRSNAEPLYVRLSGKPRFDRTGNLIGYRGTARDVTSERRAEASARAAQANLVSALESSSDGFSLWDDRDRLLVFNARFENFFFAADRGALVVGRTFEEIVRRYAERMMAKGGQQAIEDYVSERLKLHRMARGSYLHNLPDGRWILTSDRRTPEGFTVTVNRDITELKRRELQLEQALEENRLARERLSEAKEQAELANRTKSEFVAILGHELRSPLNAVIGFSEMMAQERLGALGHPSYRGYANDIVDSARHLLSLIDDLLDLSKLEAGRMTLEEDIVDLADVLRGAIAMVKQRAEDGGLTLTVSVAGNLPPVIADERKMKQVFLNLLTNAIKFTEPGGSVAVTVGPQAKGILCEVSDTGVGIDPQDIPAVLTPFGQINNQSNRRHKGTGLGVPLTKRMVELHGGIFEIDSAPNTGTRIRFTIPAERVEAAARIKRDLEDAKADQPMVK